MARVFVATIITLRNSNVASRPRYTGNSSKKHSFTDLSLIIYYLPISNFPTIPSLFNNFPINAQTTIIIIVSSRMIK